MFVTTYPNDWVKFWHCDLFGPLDGRCHLLLVLLREEGKNLTHDGRKSFDDFGLKNRKGMIINEFKNQLNQGWISSTFYDHTKVIRAAFLYFRSVCVCIFWWKEFGKKLLVKCWWNWPLRGLKIGKRLNDQGLWG